MGWKYKPYIQMFINKYINLEKTIFLVLFNTFTVLIHFWITAHY